MFNYFRAENYRGLEDLEIDGLQQVNLIAGPNNVGKTALLEALWIRHGYHNPSLPLTANNVRGKQRLSSDELLWDLFSYFDPEREIRLTADEDEKPRTLKIEFRKLSEHRVSLDNGGGAGDAEERSENTNGATTTGGPGHEIVFQLDESKGRLRVRDDQVEVEEITIPSDYPKGVYRASRARPSNESLAERLSRAKEHRKSDRLVETLDVMEPAIHDVQVNFTQGAGPTIVCDIGWQDRLVPLGVLGEGVSRLLEIALSFVGAEGGMLLIDELENGLHHSTHESIWKNIGELSEEFDTQVFATTHSYECIEAAHSAFDKGELDYDFQLIRLEEREDGVTAVRYDRSELEAALEGGFEVR